MHLTTVEANGEVAELHARIDALERECGCEASAMVGVAGLCIYLTSFALFGGWVGDWPVAVVIGFFVFAATATAAKVLALNQARKRRDHLITQLSRGRSAETSTVPPSTGVTPFRDLHV